jgi:cytoskeletal protein CcmA (bactofilin family)
LAAVGVRFGRELIPTTVYSPDSESAGNGSSTTFIGSGTRVEGEIGGSASLIVEGVVVGLVELDDRLAIAPGGLVRGGIRAASVRVAGAVEGDIESSELIEILESGKVAGDLAAPRVVINPGASFRGSIAMSMDDSSPAAGPRNRSGGVER